MSKKPFIPPIPYAEPPSEETMEKISNMKKKDIKNFKKSDEYKKYVSPILKSEKENRKKRRKEWFWSKGIVILNTVFALIAAIAAIIALLR